MYRHEKETGFAGLFPGWAAAGVASSCAVRFGYLGRWEDHTGVWFAVHCSQIWLQDALLGEEVWLVLQRFLWQPSLSYVV